jgi:hypothetical protein
MILPLKAASSNLLMTAARSSTHHAMSQRVSPTRALQGAFSGNDKHGLKVKRCNIVVAKHATSEVSCALVQTSSADATTIKPVWREAPVQCSDADYTMTIALEVDCRKLVCS